jgi:hypothetical protein
MKGEKGKGDERYRLKLWYTGTTTTKNRVGIMIDKSLKDGVINIKQQGDMVILVKLLVRDLILLVLTSLK